MSRFPRADAVIEAHAGATMLRRAAEELDKLASDAPALEPGTLRRRIRAIGIDVAFQVNGDQHAD